MTEHQPFGTQLRLGQLDGHGDGRLMIVPLDHSVADGPIEVHESLDELVGDLADGGVDAVVLHKGTLRQIQPRRFMRMSLIVHLSASTAHAPDPDAKYLVSSVESALRLGADAVSIHVNMGSQAEEQQIGDLARIAESCDRWSLPLLAMVYARGPEIANPKDPALLAHAAALAADLGADIVKITHPGSEQALVDIVSTCPIPVVVAGGPPVDNTEELLDLTASTMRTGAAGLAMGRNIFGAPDPGALAAQITDVVHSRRSLVAAPGFTRVG